MSSANVSALIRQAREAKEAARARWERERYLRKQAENEARIACRSQLTPVMALWPARLDNMNDMPVAAVMCVLEAFAPRLACLQPSTLAEIDAFCEGVDCTRISWREAFGLAQAEVDRVEVLFRQRLPGLWEDLGLLGQDPG